MSRKTPVILSVNSQKNNIGIAAQTAEPKPDDVLRAAACAPRWTFVHLCNALKLSRCKAQPVIVEEKLTD